MSATDLRVLIVHNRYRSEQPSGENNVVDQEVALLAAHGVAVDVFERRSDDIDEMSLLAKAAIPTRVPWNRGVRSELTARLRDNQPDIVHIHNTFPLLSPSVLAACHDSGVPAVATLHNYQQVCPVGTLFRAGQMCADCTGGVPIAAVRHGCYRGSSAATLPLALSLAMNRRRWWYGVERFLCISAAQRTRLVEAGMPADRLVVKYNLVPDPGVLRRGAGEYVLYLGRLTEEKGVRVLMAAWDQLATGPRPGVPLLIAGTGPLEPEIRAWAANRHDVKLLGLRSREECVALLAAAAAVTAPSTWLEGFGLVVAEAMAVGVPAVAARHGAFVELVEDGVTGILHRPGDPAALAAALLDVLASAERNTRMGAAGRARYERFFSSEAGLERLLAEYEATLANPTRALVRPVRTRSR